MGFFSRLFGRNKKKEAKDSIEPVTIDDLDKVFESEPEVDESPIVIEPITETNPKKSVDVDFHSEVVTDNGQTKVKITVDGSQGPRVYTKDFDTVESANDFVSTSTTKIINWVNDGKSLYQTMSYLQMSRIS